jgi:hypothetical protein
MDDSFIALEKVEVCLSTSLLNLSNILKNSPYSFRQELIQQYHYWISSLGIDANNCPEKLRFYLVGLNEIIEGRRWEAGERMLGKNGLDINSPEYAEQLLKIFSATQVPLNSKRERYEDIEVGSNSKTQSNNFSSLTNFEIILDIKNNPQNWRLDEVITRFDSYYGEEKEILLIHKTAQAIYDQEGNLNFNGNPIYRANRFNQVEIEEINKSLNIVSQQNFYSQEEQNHLASLVKQRTSIPGTIEEVIRFKTWWSDYNVATVINHQANRYANLAYDVLYEPDGYVKKYDVGSSSIDEGWFTNEARFYNTK